MKTTSVLKVGIGLEENKREITIPYPKADLTNADFTGTFYDAIIGMFGHDPEYIYYYNTTTGDKIELQPA